MHTTHLSSGGRYPVLRTVAILFMIGAVMIILAGIYAAVQAFRLPESTWGRTSWALVALASTFFGVLFAVGTAELIKLLIDVEHNTRMAAQQRVNAAASAAAAAAPSAAAVPAPDTAPDGQPAGGRSSQWLEGEETAEGALLRGH
jgi:hypothetical protein